MTGCAVLVAQSGFRRSLSAYRFTRCLLDLLRLVQRHRAVCAGWPLAEVDHALPRDALVAAINADMLTCFAVSPGHGEQLFMDEIRTDWQQLRAEVGVQSAEMLFLRHCRLIGKILGRIVLFAEHWPGQDRDGLVADYADHLPALAECLGQIRGMCCGVAAQAHCSAFKRARLLFLCSSANALLATARQRYRGVSPPVEALVASTATECLLHIVRAGFLRERVDYPVGAFYRTATESIDTVFAWIARIGVDLAGALGVNE
jgi:hypothetical protein